MAFKRFVPVLLLLCFAAATPAAAAEPLRIVGFGDSLMAGYQLDPQDAFPARLETALEDAGHDVRVSNAGVSGDTTGGGLARLDWSVSEETDLVILQLGANDMLRGLPVDKAEANLAAMIERLEARGITVLLAGMRAAPNLGADYARAFDAIYPRLAARHDLVLMPFFLEGVAAEPSLLLDDGMHPNAAGVARMVEAALPYVEEAIAKARAAPQAAHADPAEKPLAPSGDR